MRSRALPEKLVPVQRSLYGATIRTLIRLVHASGMNGARVNAIVEELRGEKIDIINWDENPAILIENALEPGKGYRSYGRSG